MAPPRATPPGSSARPAATTPSSTASGAFLVQACRYLSERLMEAWDDAEKRVQPGQQSDFISACASNQPPRLRITPYGYPSQGNLFEQFVPLEPGERTSYAQRIIAQR